MQVVKLHSDEVDVDEPVRNPVRNGRLTDSSVGRSRYGRGMGHLHGYARVSTAEQDPALQRDALTAAGCAQLWVDVASGFRVDRSQLVAVLEQLLPGTSWSSGGSTASVGRCATSTSGASGSGRSRSRSTRRPRVDGWCSTCSGRWPSSLLSGHAEMLASPM